MTTSYQAILQSTAARPSVRLSVAYLLPVRKLGVPKDGSNARLRAASQVVVLAAVASLISKYR